MTDRICQSDESNFKSTAYPPNRKLYNDEIESYINVDAHNTLDIIKSLNKPFNYSKSNFFTSEFIQNQKKLDSTTNPTKHNSTKNVNFNNDCDATNEKSFIINSKQLDIDLVHDKNFIHMVFSKNSK